MSLSESKHKAIQDKREEFRKFVFINFDKINENNMNMIQSTVQTHLIRNMMNMCLRENTELEKTLLNSAFNYQVIGSDDNDYKFDPDFYVINYNAIHQLTGEFKNNIVALLDVFLSSIFRNCICFNIIVNTLIKHNILVNIYDPSYVASDSFKDLFELQ